MPITEETDTPGWSGRPSLLIADDDPVIRSTLSSQLAPDSDVVAMADDAGQAVELAAEHRDALPPPALQDDSHPGICVERHLDRVVGRAPINHDDFGDTSGQTLDERRDVPDSSRAGTTTLTVGSAERRPAVGGRKRISAACETRAEPAASRRGGTGLVMRSVAFMFLLSL